MSGRMRSAIVLVSSGIDEKLTLNGTFAIAAAKPDDFIIPYAGFTLRIIRIGTAPVCIFCATTRSCAGESIPSNPLSAPVEVTVEPTAPAPEFRLYAARQSSFP